MSTAADMVTVVDRNTIAFERRFPGKLERVWSAITVKDEIDHIPVRATSLLVG